MSAEGLIRREVVQGIGSKAQLVKADPANAGQELSAAEKQAIDEVLGKFGEMSATEISAVSHREIAYANTRPGEPIAYEYAKFLKAI